MANSNSSEAMPEDSTIPDGTNEGPPVYVIDDESEVRRSLHFLLSTANMVSWPFASACDFLDSLDSLEPAPILLNIRMPKIDGVELMNRLRERDIDWPVIAMTAHGDIPIAVQVIKLGAIEFLEKPFEFETLQACLQNAFSQLAAGTKTVVVRNAARDLFGLLSPRETEVINVLMQGISNKAAAHDLSLSVRTVEMHRANALAKLKVKSIAEVVRLANDAELTSASADRDGDDVNN